jgi:hypothetical protein
MQHACTQITKVHQTNSWLILALIIWFIYLVPKSVSSWRHYSKTYCCHILTRKRDKAGNVIAALSQQCTILVLLLA